MAKYDEDLDNNLFLQSLQNDYCSILKRASQESWLICIPRQATIVHSTVFTQMDIMKHILVPGSSDNLYTTLTDKVVVVKENVIITKDESSDHGQHGRQHTTILFTEDIYDKFGKYKLLCIENPLFSDVSPNLLAHVTSIHEAITFLPKKSTTNGILEKLDAVAGNVSSKCASASCLKDLKQIYLDGYIKCLKLCKGTISVSPKLSRDSYTEQMLCLATETYFQFKIYPALFDIISILMQDNDAQLNVNLCNAKDIQFTDLDLDCVPDILSKATIEFDSVCKHSTTLDKIECLKRVLDVINLQPKQVLADDLILLFVMFLIKTKSPNWQTQLCFMTHFNNNHSQALVCDKESFILTTLEAAVKYVNDGSLFFMKQNSLESSKEDLGCYLLKSEAKSMGLRTKNSLVTDYFNNIKLGMHDKVASQLEEAQAQRHEADKEPVVCHPLCNCSECTTKSAAEDSDLRLTVTSRDDNDHMGIHVACAFGWPKVVKTLLKFGANGGTRDKQGNTALHFASLKGHKNCLLLLLHASVPVDTVNSSGDTALHIAARNGHVGCVKGLLYYSEFHGSINCNKQNANGDTPIHLACRYGYRESVNIILDQLLENSCDLRLMNNQKRTAADCCYNTKLRTRVIEVIQEIGTPATPQPSPSSHKKDIPLACKLATNVTFISPVLLDDKCSLSEKINSEQNENMEKTLNAIRRNDYNLVCQCLGISSEQHCDDNKDIEHDKESEDPVSGCHPLCQCSICNTRVSVARPVASIKDTVLLNGIDSNGLGLIHVVAMEGNLKILSLLLRNGCNVHLASKDIEQSYALHLACKTGHADVVAALLEHNADPNVRNGLGNTPLHVAVASGRANVVHMLLKNGARLGDKNNEGINPRELANQLGVTDIMENI